MASLQRWSTSPRQSQAGQSSSPRTLEFPRRSSGAWASIAVQTGVTHRDVHVDGLRRLLDALAAARTNAGSTPRVILSSSTGVWGDEGGGIVDESTPPNPSREAGRVLVEAETLLATHLAGPGTALRFAGLYGPGRLPRVGRPARRACRSPLIPTRGSISSTSTTPRRSSALVADAALAPRGLYVVADGHPVRRRDWYGTLAKLTEQPRSPAGIRRPLTRRRGADKRINPTLLFGDLGFRPTHSEPAHAALAEPSSRKPRFLNDAHVAAPLP